MSTISRTEARPRDQVGRAVGVVGLLGIALIHLLDAGPMFEEDRLLFYLYIALMVGTLVAAAMLLRTDSRLTWGFATAMAGLTLVGYVLSRTTGLPGDSFDIGQWLDPLGLSSLFVEGCVVLLGVYKVLTTPLMRDHPVEGLLTGSTSTLKAGAPSG
jgi:uncharacterized membrane protein YedE/YeeE